MIPVLLQATAAGSAIEGSVVLPLWVVVSGITAGFAAVAGALGIVWRAYVAANDRQARVAEIQAAADREMASAFSAMREAVRDAIARLG